MKKQQPLAAMGMGVRLRAPDQATWLQGNPVTLATQSTAREPAAAEPQALDLDCISILMRSLMTLSTKYLEKSCCKLQAAHQNCQGVS